MRRSFSTSSLFLFFLLLLLASPTRAGEEEEPPRPQRPRGPSGQALWERLKTYDKDGDGVVTREEFGGPARFFVRLDADKDGNVTKAEAEAMANRRGGGRRERAPSRTAPAHTGGLTLDLLDADRDGHVSKEEWAAFFAAADRDEDGRLSEAEWKRMLEPNHRPGGTAPAVGSKAPAVRAARLDGGETVDLSAPKRATVLVFGSWT